MSSTLDTWPKWLRWVLLLPAALLGGAVAGILIEFLTARHAESPNAPILYIAAVLGGLAATWTALYISHSFAPSHKKVVVIVLGLVALIGDMSIVPRYIDSKDYIGICSIGGTLVACFFFWHSHVRKRLTSR